MNNFDATIISLSAKEARLFEIITEGVQHYPRQFTLDWLLQRYWLNREPAEVGATVTEYESVRAGVARLGLKLFGARVGSIRRVSKRGRSNKGIYEFVKTSDWLLSNNNICAIVGGMQ